MTDDNAGGSTIAEDLLLLLFDPSSGSITGEGTLYYSLGGAVLAELALDEKILIEDGPRFRGRQVRAVGEKPPTDDLLRPAWESVAEKPREVMGLMAEIGPPLREPVIERLLQRGHLGRERRKILGLFTTTVLVEGGTGRRAYLLEHVRAVLVERAAPGPRIALVAALLSASSSLPSLHADIPWSTPIITRGKQLEHGDWGAEDAATAVARTATAAVSSVLNAVTRFPGS